MSRRVISARPLRVCLSGFDWWLLVLECGHVGTVAATTAWLAERPSFACTHCLVEVGS